MRIGLFPGQGIRTPAILEALDSADGTLTRANEVLGFDLQSRVSSAARRPSGVLPTTLAQPAIFVASVASFQDRAERFDAFVGHSLGEYAALVAAEAISFEHALQVVVARADACRRAAKGRPGAMAALLGTELEAAEAIAEATGAVVANDNAPGQVVLAGSSDALAQASALARAEGGRAVLLEVEGAFHSPAMAAAAPDVRRALERSAVVLPKTPVVANHTARPYRAPGEIRALLVEQLTSRVRFRESIEWLWDQGAREAVDLGPGNVVGGLVDRIIGRAAERERARA